MTSVTTSRQLMQSSNNWNSTILQSKQPNDIAVNHKHLGWATSSPPEVSFQIQTRSNLFLIWISPRLSWNFDPLLEWSTSVNPSGKVALTLWLHSQPKGKLGASPTLIISFNAIKQLISEHILLSFPDPNVPRDVCTDALDPQSGAAN